MRRASRKPLARSCGNCGHQKKAPGCDRIYTAGEKEHDVWMERKDKGVPMAENVQREFAQLREEYGLPKEQFLFPFEK